MIVFAIPLRAKEACNDWSNCVNRFNQTIHSIFQQTSPDFRCIVACNSIPELDVSYDSRLEFIQLEIPVPKSWVEMSRDKFWKLTAIAVRIRDLLEQQAAPDKGIYVMPVDADDFLNKNIALWCAEHPDAHGFVSKDGYVWQEGDKYVRTYKNMHTYCGSCNIIKMYLEDLPAEMPADNSLCHDKDTVGKLNSRYPIRYDHNTVVDKYQMAGKPFSMLPFRSTVYRLGTGDNISAIFHAMNHSSASDRFHPVAFLRSINVFKMRYLSASLRKEFGMDGIP